MYTNYFPQSFSRIFDWFFMLFNYVIKVKFRVKVNQKDSFYLNLKLIFLINFLRHRIDRCLKVDSKINFFVLYPFLMHIFTLENTEPTAVSFCTKIQPQGTTKSEKYKNNPNKLDISLLSY